MSLKHLTQFLDAKEPDDRVSVQEVRDLLAKSPYRYEKGAGPVTGERTASAKLTADQVREIRRKAASRFPGWSVELAKEYGVNVSAIKKIVHRQSWKHI